MPALIALVMNVLIVDLVEGSCESVYEDAGALVNLTDLPAGPSPTHVVVDVSQYPDRMVSHHLLFVAVAPNDSRVLAFVSAGKVAVMINGAVKTGPPWSTIWGRAG